MRDFDDYPTEMRRFGGFSEEEVDRLLSGSAPSDAALEDLAASLRGVREQLMRAPEESTRQSHLLALAAAAEEIDPEASETAPSRPLVERQTFGRRIMRRAWLIGSKGVAVGGALALSTLGFAYAGVDLPGTAAERAWEAVGVDLPNQAHEGSSAEAVREVIESNEYEGCSFGQAVAAAASGNADRQGPKDDPCDGDGSGGAEAKGSKATGEERSADGRAKAAEKSGGRSEAGSDNAGSNDDAGRTTGSEKSDGKSDSGSGNAGSGGTSGSSETGGDTSSEKSGGKSTSGSGGTDTASEKSGGTSDTGRP